MDLTPQSAKQKMTQFANLPSNMNNQDNDNNHDIEMLFKAFDDFVQHSEIEVNSDDNWKELAEEYTNQFFEKKASELEVTVDYYMQEFL
jgi:hypothetical protein